ncbi:hypothetical protein BD414DRAFT_534666 [Trametes punicea]|nr:hypothetical protein BD414DRAFT_534666 [Trametes punicea]
MTPRKRKRTSLHDDLPVKGASQTQRSRLSSASSPQKKASSRAARSRARTAEKETSSQTRSRNQKPPPSPIPPAAKTPGRRAASRSRTSRDSSAGPSSSTIRRATSRISEVLGKATLAVRKPPSSRRNKGTGKALPVNRETISHIDEEDLVDAEPSPPSGTRRPAKRRKLSPDESLETADSSTAFLLSEVDMDSQETAVEENFEMLDLPDDAYLPWVPIDPGSKESAYVPPGLNALIEDMKRALVLQISARQKAESMHAEELRRRCQLEEEAARLADANRALEAERSAWTASAAEALASTLESALVADMSRRLAAEIPLTTPEGRSRSRPRLRSTRTRAQGCARAVNRLRMLW